MPVTHFDETEVTAMLAVMLELGKAKGQSEADETETPYTVELKTIENILEEFGIIDSVDFMTELEEVLPENLVLNSNADRAYWISE